LWSVQGLIDRPSAFDKQDLPVEELINLTMLSRQVVWMKTAALDRERDQVDRST
jgi:hypothetical protein